MESTRRNRRKRISKKMSYVLRHRPDVMDLTLDPQGWVATSDLLDGFARSNWPLTREELDDVVESNSKQRFEFSEDGHRIRARQGHSVDVDLGYTPETPPEYLFHGTPQRNVATIQAEGLHKMKRHHVHLSPDLDTARIVGRRRDGKATIFRVAALEMQAAGAVFYKTDNDVWLTEAVEPGRLSVYEAD